MHLVPVGAKVCRQAQERQKERTSFRLANPALPGPQPQKLGAHGQAGLQLLLELMNKGCCGEHMQS